MRRHLLLIITFAILLPALAVLLVSGFGLVQHEWAMESVARSYVQDMAENVASRLSLGDSRRWSSDLTAVEIRRIRIFTWGPSLPGWVAVVGSDGRILFTSPGAGDLQAIWRLNIPIGRAVEIKDEEGNLYTVAVNPVKIGRAHV